MTIQIVSTGSIGSAGASASPVNAFFTQTTSLEGTPYLLSFQYNQRCDRWYLSIADASAVDIYNGIKLICRQDLLKKCADPRKPPGSLFLLSQTTDNSPPGLNDIIPSGGRCVLYYMTSDWVALLQAGNSAAIYQQLATNTQGGTASTYGQVGF
jgi:hypothetical protein